MSTQHDLLDLECSMLKGRVGNLEVEGGTEGDNVPKDNEGKS